MATFDRDGKGQPATADDTALALDRIDAILNRMHGEQVDSLATMTAKHAAALRSIRVVLDGTGPLIEKAETGIGDLPAEWPPGLSDDDRSIIHQLLGDSRAVDVAIQLCDEGQAAAIHGLLHSKTKLKYHHLQAESDERRAKQVALILLQALHDAD